MSNGAYARLIEGGVYRFGDLLLEAVWCDGWTFMLLTRSGEYVPVTSGTLVAYELRSDRWWNTVFCSQLSRGYGKAQYSFYYGNRIKIEPVQLVFVAACRADVQTALREQEVEREIREFMATLEF